jgi:hypothetical protein
MPKIMKRVGKFLKQIKMNIYALKGHKVKCKTFSAGYDYQKKIAQKHLEVGKEYTIEETQVENSYTDVWLQEFPNVQFNSVFFEDAVEQSEEMDKKHPDYFIYH